MFLSIIGEPRGAAHGAFGQQEFAGLGAKGGNPSREFGVLNLGAQLLDRLGKASFAQQIPDIGRNRNLLFRGRHAEGFVEGG